MNTRLRVLLRLGVWLFFGLLGALLPSGIHALLLEVTDKTAGYREIFGYSTIILVAYGIFLSSMGDVFVDGHWSTIGGSSAGIAFTLALLVGPLCAVAVLLDIPSAKFVVDDTLWFRLEMGMALVLAVFSSIIKVQMWT